jgi:hypothetical protein
MSLLSCDVTAEGMNLKDGSVPDCQLQLASFGVDRGDPEGYVKCDVGNELHSKNIISGSSTDHPHAQARSVVVLASWLRVPYLCILLVQFTVKSCVLCPGISYRTPVN